MATIFFFLIYLSNIICIICIKTRNTLFSASLIKKLLPNKQYEKISIDYNINILINEKDKIVKEFFINTTNNTNINLFDFSYSGKIFSLNDTNLFELSTKDYRNQNQILLIRKNTTFNNFMSNNKLLIRFLTKVIFVPKNTIANIDLISKFCFYDFSILLIDLDESIFNSLENCSGKTTIKIVSKKIDLLSYSFLLFIITIIVSLLFIVSSFDKLLLKLFKNNYNNNQIIFFNTIITILNLKTVILLFLGAQLCFFYSEDGFVFEYTSFFQSLIIFFMIISESNFISLIQKIYYGIGINMKGEKIMGILMGYLTGFYLVFYILFNVFVNPLRFSYAFYILSLFVSFPIFSEMVYFSIKNIILLCKAYSKVRSIKISNERYGKGIKLKIIFIIIQFILLFLFSYLYFILHEYLLFKQGLCFTIEKDILFQSYECCFMIFLSIIYLPADYPQGYELYILMIKNSKKTSRINILPGDNNYSSLPKDELNNEENIKKYVRKNANQFYVVLNPKVYFDKNKRNNKDVIIEENEKENYTLAKQVKLGKLIRTF